MMPDGTICDGGHCPDNEGIWSLSAKGPGAAWVFPQLAADAVNQYVDFRQSFAVADPGRHATLWICADTDFVVWLNGTQVGHGQFPNHPDHKTYERFALDGSLRPGSNLLVVTVFYNGRNSSVYARGEAGAVFAVCQGKQLLATSGPETEWRMNPCYHSGPIATVSHQLSYTFGYDARALAVPQAAASDGEWRRMDQHAVHIGEGRETLSPRPVARMVDDGVTSARLHACGVFLRDTRGGCEGSAGCCLPDGTMESPAQLMQRDLLRAFPTRTLLQQPGGVRVCDCSEGLTPDGACLEGYTGFYLVLDLGREEVGYLSLDIEAPAGTIVDIGYGEHLDDLRVRTQIGGRNFASRYICGNGRQRFVHPFLRWAGRYLQLQIQSDACRLYGCELLRCAYPVQAAGRVALQQASGQQILATCRRTLQLCMHDHYEDTPWREQALYANDARTQALCGYYAFGETQFPAASFSLLGHSLRPDGFLALTAPARPPLTIPSFSLVWMLAIHDHYLFSGDARLAQTWLPQILSMLQSYLAERREGLWPLRQAEGIWHFYDWAEGMSGYEPQDFANGLVADAPLNCFLILALQAALQMVEWVSQEQADVVPDGTAAWLVEALADLRTQVAASFWDPGEGAFVTTREQHQLSELVQGLAVLARVGDEKMRAQALARIVQPDAGLVRASVSQSLYVFEALMLQKPLYGSYVLGRIEKIWGGMLAQGATAFWETQKGAADFHDAGSLCHGWSAVPLYIYFAHVLGVRPVRPGFARFSVDPLAEGLQAGGGEVPVPGGCIKVTGKRVAGKTCWEARKRGG